MNAQTGQVKY